jgi:hypothetical protein
MNTDLLGFLSLSLSPPCLLVCMSSCKLFYHMLLQEITTEKLKEDYVELMHVDYMTIV